MPDSDEPTSDTNEPQADGSGPIPPADTVEDAPLDSSESAESSSTSPDESNESEKESSSDKRSDKGPDLRQPEVKAALARYWRTNVRIMTVLLAIWAFVGLGCGVLFADWLNQWRIGGYPLGFWFAQQGSVIVFVVIILVYCLMLNKLDAKHHEDLKRLKKQGKG
jgi:putative solute:sodium symporter small subunit